MGLIEFIIINFLKEGGKMKYRIKALNIRNGTSTTITVLVCETYDGKKMLIKKGTEKKQIKTHCYFEKNKRKIRELTTKTSRTIGNKQQGKINYKTVPVVNNYIIEKIEAIR